MLCCCLGMDSESNVTNLPEYVYKVIIVGSSQSGKTSFFRRWIYDEFVNSMRFNIS